jgi:EF hand
MKKNLNAKIVTVLIGGLLYSLGNYAIAAPTVQYFKGNPKVTTKPSNKTRYSKLDLNRDGFISQSELKKDSRQRSNAFKLADKNADHQLDPDEYKNFRQQLKKKRKISK